LSGDAAASPTGATPALAPTQPHGATAAAPTADASLLAGHGAAIDTRADNWHEALASRVQVLVDQNIGEAHIKLNPPELGAVDIKISLVDDKTFVQLTAGSSAARDELTQSLPRLRELLSAGGLSLGGASVHGGGAGQSGGEGAPRVAVPAYPSFAAADDDEIGPIRAAARATGRIDLFA
jgi:flagellar hook-length control protein FliK